MAAGTWSWVDPFPDVVIAWGTAVSTCCPFPCELQGVETAGLPVAAETFAGTFLN